MRTRLTKIICTVLTVCLAGGAAAGILAAAQGGETATDPKAPAASVSSTETETQRAQKNETVYVLAGSDGSVKRIIVSDWIKNVLGEDELKDTSDLSGIETVKGDATYVMGGDGTRIWDADGKDIYYSGSIERELPVSVRVSYRLNGEVITAEELTGRSGKVTIRFDYTATQCETMTADGKETTLCVPFVMLTGLLLDNDSFSDVSVTNGRLINDGDRTAVVGIALPGLAEDLGLSAEQVSLPSYVEINASTTSFHLATTVSLATCEPFGAIDLSLLDRAEATLAEKLTALTDAMTKLTDGSAQLYDGVCALLEKSELLVSGIGQLADGLGQLTAQSQALRDGARSVYTSLLSAAQTQLAAAGIDVTLTVENYETVLNGVIASLGTSGTGSAATARDAITAAVTAAVRDQVAASVTEGYREQVLEAVLATQGLTVEQYRAAQAADLITAEQQDRIDAAVYLQMRKTETQTAIAALTDAQMATEDVRASIAQNVTEQVNAAIDEIQALKQQLDAYGAFCDGVGDYTAGVDTAYAGIAEIVDSLPKLTAGIGELQSGAERLRDGIATLDEELVQKLCAAVTGDLDELTARLRAIVRVSQNYQAFAGLSDSMDGQVKFIFSTDGIEAN